MALDTDSTLWDYQTYYDPQAQAMAASRACFLLSGETGRHLFGSYYLIGDSWFSARKAPYDTKPYHLNLTFADYRFSTSRIQVIFQTARNLPMIYIFPMNISFGKMKFFRESKLTKYRKS